MTSDMILIYKELPIRREQSRIRLKYLNTTFCEMNSRKWKLNIMILQTDLVICSIDIIGIANRFHYVNNQFSLNF